MVIKFEVDTSSGVDVGAISRRAGGGGGGGGQTDGGGNDNTPSGRGVKSNVNCQHFSPNDKRWSPVFVLYRHWRIAEWSDRSLSGVD